MNPPYDLFRLPVYVNTSPALTLNGTSNGEPVSIPLCVPDIILSAIVAGLNVLLISDTGRGKTQLVTDIRDSYFNGAGPLGKANFLVARPEMSSIMSLFETVDVDTSSGRYNSDTARQLNPDRVSRLLCIVDELNRTPEIKQAEFFDLADGKYAFKGESVRLGRDGYSCFIATMNMNKNGDNGFTGTSTVDRALLGRTHLTLDLDTPRFRPTIKDDEELESRGYSTAQVKSSEPKDLTEQILLMNQQIRQRTKEYSLQRRIFRHLISRSLSYCEKDPWNDKQGMFPMACGECDKHSGKLCSLSKACSERTLQSVNGLSAALALVAEMKFGREVQFNYFDALLEAYRLTSFHGNLNSQVLSETYAGRRQLMMDNLIENLRRVCSGISQFVIDGQLHSRIINFELNTRNGKVKGISPFDDSIVTQIRIKKGSLNIFSLEDLLKIDGLGDDLLRIRSAP